MAEFILHYPRFDNQVHNRSNPLVATDDLPLIFSMLGATSDIEARWNGGAWATVQADARGTYTATLDDVSGQATLDVRPVDYPSMMVTRTMIGIGDVFLIAGQSNASGRGTNNQSWSHATLTAMMHANDYTWKTLADPVDSDTGILDSITDESALTPPAGSVWPIVATEVMAVTGCPVGFIPTAMGATSITQWARPASQPFQARTGLYGQSISRAYWAAGVRHNQTGIRYVLWWQGEGDTTTMDEPTYRAALKTLANGYMTDTGAKLVATRLQLTVAGEIEVVNTAIVNAAGENVNVLVGADLSDIATDDDAHLKIDGKLLTAGQRIAAAVLDHMGY
jgi:hypothetical protein